MLPEYSWHQLELVRQTCLFVASKLGDLLDEMVVVGGLVPHLLVDLGSTPPGLDSHAGTIDLDLGLGLALLGEQRYRELAVRLRAAGFEPDMNQRGNRTPQTWITGPPQTVTVDFLIPPPHEAKPNARILHIEPDLAAIVTPGLELAFFDRTWIELSDTLPTGAFIARHIPVCGPGAFTVLKALAFGNRTNDKDAYDLHYLWNALGVEDVAERLALLRPNASLEEALNVIRRDFCDLDGPGPVGVAHFLNRINDDELQADVAGEARRLCELTARLLDRNDQPTENLGSDPG